MVLSGDLFHYIVPELMLEILYRDNCLIAINKPHGLLVHRSNIATDAKEFAVQMLRNQCGQKVWPVHRIDRKTAGILLFAVDYDIHRHMQMQFSENLVSKKYLAIVRGYTPESGIIDYPLVNDDGKTQEAVTEYVRIAQSVLDVPHGKHATSRYSLVEIYPKSGRMHQIRKHFSHILHPIIGDRPHGCNKQNKLFLENWNMNTMLLHAREITFKHPETKDDVKIIAPLQEEFKRMMNLMKFVIENNDDSQMI